MKSFKALAFTSLLCLSLGFIAPVSANEHAKRPCAEDMKKFCGDVKPGKGAMAQCMKQHEAELSPDCKAHGEAMKAKMEQVHEACKGDVEKFCKDMKPGDGRIASCLKEHKSELSEACQSQMKRSHGRMKHSKEQ